jgi:hypothetical protein
MRHSRPRLRGDELSGNPGMLMLPGPPFPDQVEDKFHGGDANFGSSHGSVLWREGMVAGYDLV